jgi:hypothetical protein
VRASRITYVGELGWELYVPSEFMQGVYDELLSAGRGVLARSRRLSCAQLPAHRKSLSSLRVTTSPTKTRRLEAGLGFAVKWDKPGGFIGRERFAAAEKSGCDQALVQFKLESSEPLLYHNEPIWHGDSDRRIHSLGNVRAFAGWCRGLRLCDPAPKARYSTMGADDYEIEVAGIRCPAAPRCGPSTTQKTSDQMLNCNCKRRVPHG